MPRPRTLQDHLTSIENTPHSTISYPPYFKAHLKSRIPIMPNTVSINPLPDGLMDELMDQLPPESRFHLLFNVTTASPQRSAENNFLNQSSTQELQHFIFSNMTRVGALPLSKDGHDLSHILLLYRIITRGHFYNLVELDLYLNPSVKWSDETQESLLQELYSLAPAILSSLPRLRSFTPLGVDQDHFNLTFFSLPGLFPAGQSSHLEKLCLSHAHLKKAQFKYLALHSNYVFPALTHLDVSTLHLGDTAAATAAATATDDDQDDNSTMHYLLKWLEKSMPKLAHFSLALCKLTTTDLTTDLSNSPILSQLESLDFSFNPGVEAEGWGTLFTSIQFTNSRGQDPRAQIKTLKLDHNPSIKSQIPLLAQNCPYLTNLTTLSLNGCDLNNRSIQSICNSTWIRGLESISFENNVEVTSQAIQMIVDCEGMRNLTSLEFGDLPGQFSLDLLHHLAQSQHVSKLTKIGIDLSEVSSDQGVDQVVVDFFHSPKASSLTDLFLFCTNIPQPTMKLILLSPMLSNLEVLEVSDGDENQAKGERTNQWIDAFVSSPNCSKLQCLILSDCNLTDSNVLAISESPHLSNLSILDLSDNHMLTDDSVRYLAQSERMQLKELYLYKNPLLTPLTFLHLTQSPRILSGLATLSVWGCPLIGTDEEKYQDILAKAGWFDGKIKFDW